ncbi:MAG TPA: glycerol-3-phosphate 1-O-acyltransferase PlsY [Candidatus Caenarcaniphilales bacterium]
MAAISFWLIVGVMLLSSYLVGAIPVGYLTGRLLKGIDIRQHGSGSTGATNVLRTLGKGPGLMVLLIDVLKGVLAIALVRWVYAPGSGLNQLIPEAAVPQDWLPWMVIFSGLAAILGHSKSLWINFTGGKSVATSLGLLLMMSWPVGLATVAIFAGVLALTRIVSLSSITAAISLPLLMVVLQQPLPYVLFSLLGSSYVIWRHKTNLQRLLQGSEPRLGETSEKTEMAS